MKETRSRAELEGRMDSLKWAVYTDTIEIWSSYSSVEPLDNHKKEHRQMKWSSLGHAVLHEDLRIKEGRRSGSKLVHANCSSNFDLDTRWDLVLYGETKKFKARRKQIFLQGDQLQELAVIIWPGRIVPGLNCANSAVTAVCKEWKY